ncbi:L-2-amino-thiazoline-4-carboxylic acid hydrolase [Microvirga sp. 2MCAF38]|uniref:L-2-amino-thiazoline-4-carboxylic acid hydrolase n=1 Tax=Microvirga sp. 2MCAF38 TaxID=3232989 RepID=UPI003F9D3B3D
MTVSTDKRADKLAQELESAFRNRADLYRLMYDELTLELGAEEAEAIMIRAIEKRGQEVATTAFATYRPDQALEIGEAFLSVSPDEGRMYPTDVERREDGISFKVKRCPLKDAWVEAGVGEDKLTSLCRIAGAFDRGLFEATGIRFDNVTWSPGHGSGCCHINLTNRDAP